MQDEDEEIVAHRWVTEVFEPVVRAVPKDLRGKLEPAEIFHEVLEHRWFLSERAGRDVGLMPAAQSYVADVLTPQAGRAGRPRLADRQPDAEADPWAVRRRPRTEPDEWRVTLPGQPVATRQLARPSGRAPGSPR